MKCTQPRRITKNLDIKKFPDGLLIPCGQCMACRIMKREEWVMRILHEYDYWNECIFCTLTYADEHLPENASLRKSDVQKFFKRLRKNTQKKIKYFCCGEYGEGTGRPHYHCIIFGLDYLSDVDIMSIKGAWSHCHWETQRSTSFGYVNGTSIRYVVSYLEKSIKGKWQEYAYNKIEVPFHLISKGLGKQYAEDNKNDLQKNGFVNYKGFKKGIPRYYTDILGIPRDMGKSFAEEKEKDFVEEILGIHMSRDQVYRSATTNDVRKLEDTVTASNKQRDMDIKAKDQIRIRRKVRDT